MYPRAVSILIPSTVTYNWELNQKQINILFGGKLERSLQMLHQNSINIMIFLHSITLENNSEPSIQGSLQKLSLADSPC